MVFAFAFLTTWTASADRPAGVTAQTLILPSGPASLKGLGESFEPNMATGTGNYSVAIELPPGFVSPQVSLNYTGGRGKGVLGQSWSLPVLQIYRQTDKGSPNFDEEDRFAVQGPQLNDELVRVNEQEGYYRLKNEGAFALFVRDSSNNSWTIRLPGGQTAHLGSSLESRETSKGNAYRWFIDRQEDRFGHWTEYHYFTEQGKTYLSEITYQMHASSAYRNSVVVQYEVRPDVFTDYTYGSACTTAKRVSAIQVFHGARQIRTYSLAYDEGLLFSLLTRVEMEGEGGLKKPPLSFEYLRENYQSGGLVTMKDVPPLEALLDGSGELDDVNGDGLPDLIVARSGAYRYYENYDGRRFESARQLRNSPDRDLYEEGVVFVDVDGDGFRDLIHPQGDAFRYYPGGNIAKGVFQGYREPIDLDSTSDGYSFTSAALKMGDQNGDGRIDLLWQKPGQDTCLINGEDGVIREENIAELPVDIDFSDPRVEMTDFNGDGVMDFVRKEIGFDESKLRVWFGFGRGRYLPEQPVINVPKGDPANFYLQDVNRDGQTDLVRISGSWATFYLNRGNLRFSGKQGDFYGLPAASATQKLLFSDVNGNGTRDVVWVTTDYKLHYLDLSGEPNAGLLTRIDNGMGLVTDIAYRSSTEYAIEAKQAGKPWVHPLPIPVPVISELRSTDSLDVIGLRATESLTSYEYRDGYYDGEEREFRGFAEAIVTSWGDASHETLVTRTKMHVGRNPDTFADEEVLKGKPFFQVQTDDAGAVFSSVETKWEMRHLCQEDLPGVPTALLPNCATLGDLSGKKDELVTIGVSTDAFTATYERTPNARYTATHTEFDAWGNPTESVNFGEVGYGAVYTPGMGFEPKQMDVAVGDDEQETRTKYLYQLDEWLIGLTTETELRDLEGGSYDRTQTFYDSAAFGQATHGLVARVRKHYADENRWIVQEQNEYDAHGNKTATVNAAGDRVELRYEPNTGILPNLESVQVGRGDGPGDWVQFSAQYDLAYGAMTRSVGPNGDERRMTLDGLGRVTELYDPGGELPVSKFAYSYGTSEYPVSVTRADQLIERTGRYHTSWSYTDGAGRVRQEKETAESSHGYVASAWTQLSSRGKPVQVYDPFSTRTLGLEEPPADAPVTFTSLDALGRPLEVDRPSTDELPSGSRILTSYRPLETRAYSERESSLGELDHPVVTKMDGLGRVREVEKFNSVRGELQRMRWRIGYDARGNIVSLGDPQWNGDPTDQRHLRHYTYDSLGRLTTVEDPNAGRTNFAFDDLGRIVRRVDPLGQVQEWQYGKAGRLLLHQVTGDVTGADDYEHRYHYDTPAPDSPLSTTAASNLRGKLSWIEFPTGEEHYAYDALGRVQEEVHRLWNPESSPFESQLRDTYRRGIDYRADGKVTRDRTPGGLELTYGYNERGAVESIGSLIGEETRQILSAVGYDHRGSVVRSDFGNGIRSCSTFNERGELTGSRMGKASEVRCDGGPSQPSGGYQNLHYRRGYDGLITAIDDLSNPSWGLPRLDAAYEYDAVQQLIGVSDPRGETKYTYDEIQNLVRREIINDIQDRPTGEFAYGEQMTNGELAGPNAITTADGETYEYDVAGQMLRYNGYDLRFDGEGRLVEASNVNTGVRLVQHYDDAGERRIALVYRTGKPVQVHRFIAPEYQIRDGEEVWFARGGSLTAEIVKSQGILVDAFLLDQLTAYVSGAAQTLKPLPEEYMDLNGDGNRLDEDDLETALAAYQSEVRVGGEKFVWRFVTADHLGGASHVTDSVGDLVSHQRFHAYGAVASRWGERPWAGGYIGKDIEPDADLGLLRMGARYYAPKLARWVTPDPLLAQSPRLAAKSLMEAGLYGYGTNNPIMGKDPSGFLELEVSTGEALNGDGKLLEATRAMASEMQEELKMHFGIATTKTDDWNGADLDLGSSDAMTKAYKAAEARMKAAGASSAEIDRWNKARDRLIALIDSSEEIDMTTEDSKGNALIAGEVSPWANDISMNPFTWFDGSGKSIAKGTSAAAKARMGPTMMLLHELGHVNGCMSGSSDCRANAANAFNLSLDPEQKTTEDVNAHTDAIPNMVSRPRYNTGANRPGGQIKLSGGEIYYFPSDKQLRKGAP